MTSLTSPYDRKTLTDDEAKEAFKELKKTFPRIEQAFCDPLYSNQIYCLHSFIPSKAASPDPDGIYGMIKCRGVFPTLEEADKRAEYIIKNYDSIHRIYTSYTGRPFPLCDTSKFSEDINEIDLQKKTMDVMKEDLKKRKEEDDKEIKDMQEREKKLLEESKRNEKNNVHGGGHEEPNHIPSSRIPASPLLFYPHTLFFHPLLHTSHRFREGQAAFF